MYMNDKAQQDLIIENAKKGEHHFTIVELNEFINSINERLTAIEISKSQFGNLFNKKELDNEIPNPLLTQMFVEENELKSNLDFYITLKELYSI